MSTTNKQLLQAFSSAVSSALDCSTHFYTPTIINTDPGRRMGERSAVICQTCVERLEKLVENSQQPHYPFPILRAKVTE